MAVRPIRPAPPERRPPRRWDTFRAIGYGLMLGFVLGLAYGFFGFRKHTPLLFIEWSVIGAVGGAFILGVLVELRNRLFGAI